MNAIQATEFESLGIKDVSSLTQWKKADEKVQQFLSGYLTSEVFKKIIVLNSRFLRNKDRLDVLQDAKCKIIDSLDMADKYRTEIKRACISHGHMSILFIADCKSNFLKDYFALNYYRERGQVFLCTGMDNDPLSSDQCGNFLSCVQGLKLEEDKCIFVFSHDADYLYEIKAKNNMPILNET